MSPASTWDDAVRRLLAAALDRPLDVFTALPATTPLFGPAVNLDSFSGMALLALIQRDYGLDLATDDLGLDSLETIATLAAYLAAHEVVSRQSSVVSDEWSVVSGQ